MTPATDPDTTPFPGLLPWLDRNLERVGYTLAGLGVACLAAALTFALGRFDIANRPDLSAVAVFLGLLALLLAPVGLANAFLAPPAGQPGRASAARTMALGVGGMAGLIIASLGVVLLVTWYSPLEDWLKFGKREGAWRVLLGVATLLAGLAVMFLASQTVRGELRSHPGLRRTVYGYNAALTGLLMLAILAVVNVWVSLKVPSVIDSTANSIFSMSERSAQVVAGLSKPTKFYLLMSSEDKPLFEDTRTLLANCLDRNPKLSFEHVSTDMPSGRLKELAGKFPQMRGPQGYEEGVLIVYGDEKPENARFIKRDELIGTDPGRRGSARFEGEGKLITELSFLGDNLQKPIIYFTQGAGEYDLANAEPGKEFTTGVLKQRLEEQNFDVRPLRFDAANPEVPADATVVVIVGPRQEFIPPVVAALRAYLAAPRNGKLLALFDVPANRRQPKMPATGLETLLTEFGVKLTDERVLNAIGIQIGGRTLPPEVTLVTVAPRAPAPLLTGFGDSTFFLEATRVVRPGAPTGGFKVEPLFTSFEQIPVVAESDLQAGGEQVQTLLRGDPKLMRERRQTRLPVAVTVTQGGGFAPPGQPPVADKPKLVVIGTASLADNLGSDARARQPTFDLMLGLLNWLRERPANIGIPPRNYQFYTLGANLTPARSLRMLVFDPGLILLAITGLGLGVWIARRR